MDAIAIHFRLPDARYVESVEVASNVMLDFDADGRVIGIELLEVAKMFATSREPPLPEPAPDPFDQALEAYTARFGAEHAPFVSGLGREELKVAAALLRYAVTSGKPLKWWQIMDALGIGQPPNGATT